MRNTTSQEELLAAAPSLPTSRRKKKRLSMAIPDENASLQDRFGRISDVVGPLTNRKPQNSHRNGVWVD